MKKVHLVAASALLSVLLASGFAQAATTAAKDTAPKGAMMKSPEARQEMMTKMKPIHDAMTKMHEENKENFEKIEAAQKELGELAKADTFDKSAYVAKATEIETLRQKMATARVEAMAEGLSKMSAADRKSMPEMMMGMGPHMGATGKGRMGRGPMMGGMKGPAPEAPAEAAPDSGK